MADLQHLARADGRRRIAALLERFDIVDAADKLAATYSGGLRRRLDLAMTLIGSPRIIFLDEPTTGLDPRSPRAMWQVIRGLVADGTTVFLTTQYLEEADQLADHIAILDGARLVAQGTPEQLKRHIHDGHVDLRFADAASLRSAADVLATDGNVATLRRVLGELDYAGIDVEDMSIHTPDLDDVF
jgi:ABC-2 type transport system ATP-binding protein